MLKIFITEYIIFVEDLDILFYDNFFSQYSFLFQRMEPYAWLDTIRLHTIDMSAMSNTPLWSYNYSLYKFTPKARYGHRIYFAFYVVPKEWFRIGYFSWFSLYYYTFLQYSNLNNLIGKSYLDFETYLFWRDQITIHYLDLYLLYDSVYGLFTNQEYYEMDRAFAGTMAVFYKIDPYKYEWLLMGLPWYPPFLKYSCIIPHSAYLTSGMFYGWKWLIYAYTTYSKQLPHSEHMLNLSMFFTNLQFNRTKLLDNVIIEDIFNLVYLNFDLEIKIYLELNLFIFLCYMSVYFSNKYKLFSYLYLSTPLYFFSPLIGRIVLVSTFVRKTVRLRNYYWLKKKFKRGFNRRSETENYYFNLIRKHLFKTIVKSYNKYILNFDKYIKKINDNLIYNLKDFKLIYCLYFLLLILFFLFLNLLLYLKNFIYYLYYFYCLRINKYVSFKNTLFLFIWYIPEIVIWRDVGAFEAYEVIKRYITYKRYYRKKEYQKYMKDQVWALYEQYMWQETRDNEILKQQYVSYYYHRYFYDYEPWYEFAWIVGPTWLSKFHLKGDIFYKNLKLYSVSTIFNFHFSKFFFLSKIRNYRILYVLNCFLSLNFWKLYYFYVYKVFFYKSNNYLKFIKIWFLYLYKLVIQIYLFFTHFFKFMLTPQRMLFSYYFYKSLPIIIIYLNTFIIFNYLSKYFLLIFNLFYLFSLYLFEIIYVHVNKFFLFIIRTFNGFCYFLFKDNYGFSNNFWYKYYMFKFYLIEYNIIYNFIIYIRNLLFNLIIIFSILYVFFSIPFFTYNDNMVFFIENLINYLNNLSITGYIDYTLNIDNLYFLNEVKFQHLFDNFVVFYTNNFANYYLDIGNAIITKMTSHTNHNVWFSKPRYARFLYIFIIELIESRERYWGIDLDRLHEQYTPNWAKWWIYFYVHLYLSSIGDAKQFMMYTVYWYSFLSIYFFWWYYVRYHIIYSYILLPLYWIWQYFFAFISFYFLYIFSFIPPLYYVFFFLFKFLYIIYSYIYLFFLYSSYCYYYYFWAIYPKIHIFLVNYSQFSEIFKYDCLKFYVGLDIFNFIKLIWTSICIFFYYLFSGFFLYFYKIIAWILMIFGFNYTTSLDFFSYNYLEDFRAFVGNFFTEHLVFHYDMNEYNGIFKDRAHNMVGKRRGIKIKGPHMMWYPFMKYLKFRNLTFEYKLRNFLFQDINILNSMLWYYKFFEFRHLNLLYFMLFSLYFHFFLIIFFSGIIFIKCIDIFKDNRYLSHSGSYEWKRSFTKRNKINLGVDDFYWLYNIRWLKTFEFYLDKYFTDDFYVYEFQRRKMRTGIYLYKTLNSLFLTENKSFSEFFEDNRYYKFRKYYFDRYTIFIKDIDYLFHIFSISKKNLKMRSKIFNFFKFDFPFFKKKRDKLNYVYDNEILHNLDRMDFVWLLYITPYFLYGRDWHDMKIFSQNLISKQIYAKIKKCLFKAYAIYEMNQKEFPFDLFEFQFFDKDFYNLMVENYGHDLKYDDMDNPVLSKISYSRYHNTLLYTQIDGEKFKKVYNLIGYEKFLNKIENYFIYLKKLNKDYFNNFIDFSLFGFMESISFTLTHITPDIAKTAVDIDRGRLIGVSYKKSMLLDEFTSTEITESVFKSVDRYLKKSNFNNIEVFSMLLREDPVTVVRPISPLWITLAIIPFFYAYIEYIDVMFRYGRFVLPNILIYEWSDFIFDQLFGIYFSDNYAWHGIWIHDHRAWNKLMRFQFRGGHIRGIVWDLRWAHLQGLWVGKYSYLFKAKLEYSYLYIYWLNDIYPRKIYLDKIWDYYFKDILKYFHIRIMFLLFDFISFMISVLIIYIFFYIIFFTSWNYKYYFKRDEEDAIAMEYRKAGNAEKAFKSFKEKERKRKEYRNRDVLIDISLEIAKHRQTVDFIEKYKEQEKKKEENKKNL